MGLGLGDLVNKGSGGVDGVDYLEFVAPGPDGGERDDAGGGRVAVAGARRGEVDAHVPRRGVDARRARATLFAGHVVWICLRVAVLVDGVPDRRRAPRRRAVGVGRARDPGRGARRVGVRAPLLNGYAVTQESDLPFAVIMRIGLFPLFLFSGTFFPVSRLPDWLQPVALVLAAVARGRAVPRPRRPARRTSAGRWSATSSFLVVCIARRMLVGRAPLQPEVDAVTTTQPSTSSARRGRAGRRGSCRRARARPLRVVERNALAYRRIWLRVPLRVSSSRSLYLLSIGIGVGGLVGKVPGPGGQPIDYDAVRRARAAWRRRR